MIVLLIESSVFSCSAIDFPREMLQRVQTSLNDSNGLPQNSVSSIAQTKDGYIWFGTQEGLARFDGLRATVYDTQTYKTLRDNYIQSLTRGQDGSLWIATRTALTLLKDGKFTTQLIAEHPITAICEDDQANVWVGSIGGLRSIKDGKVRTYNASDGLPKADIRSIVRGSDGRIWFATTAGLLGYDQGRFRLYTRNDGVPEGLVLRIAAARNGALWLATKTGVVRWDDRFSGPSKAISFSKDDRPSSVLEDDRGDLWVGFEHTGIALIRNGNVVDRYRTSDGLPSNDVSGLFKDNLGHIWVGLTEAGVVELREGMFQNFGVREGLSENMVWSVLEASDGQVWVGTNHSGLNRIDKNGTVRFFNSADGLPEGSIDTIYQDRKGSVWFGSEHGILGEIRDNHVRLYRDPKQSDARLTTILQGNDGDLWLCFHEIDGLVRFHQGVFQHFPVPGLLNTAALAPDGSLWLGSDHGGVTHLQGGRLTSFKTEQGLLSNFSQAVYVDKENVVWAGTSPGGLNRIKNGRITTYSIEQGLFDLTVGAIAEDDSGNLWMTCNKGIFRVSKKELNDYADGKISSIHSKVYGTEDGLRATECNFGGTPSVWKGAERRLWFATVAGVASVDLNKISSLEHKPSSILEQFYVDGKAMDLENAIAGPGTGNVDIRFTSPDFVAPKRINFRYRLVGYDADWVYAGKRREAFYTKLPPGHYTFQVQSANDDEEWGASITSLRLLLVAHFWQSMWFKAFCCLGFLGLVLGIYRIRTRYLIARNAELEERVRLRTKELQEAKNIAEGAREALYEQATKDGLTKLWNRRAIIELLQREVERSQREGVHVCVILADLDHFKRVNDTFGHLAGDCVLETTAQRLSDLKRSYDLIGRYGGEEFIIVLPGCTEAEGLQRAEEFRLAVAAAPVKFESVSIQVTCSFGVASAVSLRRYGDLIAEADTALYVSKRNGRNRVHCASQEGAVGTDEHIALAGEPSREAEEQSFSYRR